MGVFESQLVSITLLVGLCDCGDCKRRFHCDVVVDEVKPCFEASVASDPAPSC